MLSRALGTSELAWASLVSAGGGLSSGRDGGETAAAAVPWHPTICSLSDSSSDEDGIDGCGVGDQMRGRQRGQGGERVGHLKGRVGGVRCSQESDSWT